MLLRIKQQGLNIAPRILIVSMKRCLSSLYQIWIDITFLCQVTRLLPDAVGTTCGQRLEEVEGTEHTSILRVPFRNENGILRKWISRFDVWPYLETYTEATNSVIRDHSSETECQF